MNQVLGRWNGAGGGEAAAEVLACNGSRAWAEGVAAGRPYGSAEEVYAASDAVWRGLGREDWMEAFATHPRIGEGHAAAASGVSLAWSAREQAAAAAGGEEAEAERLVEGNRAYEARFGRTFLIRATGLSRAEILRALEARLRRSDEEEWAEAAEQQQQITRLRLERWLEGRVEGGMSVPAGPSATLRDDK